MHAESCESVEQLCDLLDIFDDPVTTLANASAFLYALLDDVNWVGFYLLRGDTLVLGPFQGNVACTRIQIDRGVCGACIRENKTQRVDDVHAFPGHIACDERSRSELVAPLRTADGRPFGVLDIDSPVAARFSEEDARELEHAAQTIAAALERI